MKNFNIEKSKCAKNSENIWGITKKNQNYLTHVVIAIVIIFFVVILSYTRGTDSIIDFSKPKIGRTLFNLFILVLCILVLAQFKFGDVTTSAQKCARPDNKSIPWSDGTTVWYKDPVFFILFFFALLWGLCTFAPGKVLNYDPSTILPSTENKVGNIILRLLCILPIIAFCIYFYKVVIRKMALIKPVSSNMYWWELPVAAFFSIVFIFLLPYVISPSIYSKKSMDGLTGGQKALYIWKELGTNRILTALALFAAIYVIIWRLQGGLFLSREKTLILKEKIRKF